MAEIKLGDKVKDMVTGYVGVAIAKTIWLNGCVRFTLQSDKFHDGKPVDTLCVDEPQLEVVGQGTVDKPEFAEPSGGPHPKPDRGGQL